MTDTRNISFRIDRNVLSIIEQESQRLQRAANQIFKSYTDWDKLQARAGMIPIAKPFLVELLNKVSNEEIESIATGVGKNTMKEIRRIA